MATESPDTPLDPAGSPQDAHEALDAALSPGKEAAYPVEVNLSRLTDELVARGVTIASGRAPAGPYDRPILTDVDEEPGAGALGHFVGDSGTTTVAGTTPADSYAGLVDVPPVPFSRGDEVQSRAGVATDIPPQLIGKVKRLRCQGGVWLADVRWRNGSRSYSIDCGALERAGHLKAPAFEAALREETEATKAELDAGKDLRDPLTGTPAATGSPPPPTPEADSARSPRRRPNPASNPRISAPLSPSARASFTPINCLRPWTNRRTRRSCSGWSRPCPAAKSPSTKTRSIFT